MSQTTPTDPIIQKLITGHHQFQAQYFTAPAALFKQLAQLGQQPQVMLISCSDSRIDPAMIFNCQPGELFVVRNIANLIPPYENNDTYHGTSAALEFGVCFLKVSHVIILGHTQCGGIQSLFENTQQVFDKHSYGLVAKWMELAKPAYERVKTTHQHCSLAEQRLLCERYALLNSLQNLASFPWVQKLTTQNQLTLHAWQFDLMTGNLNIYQAEGDSWQPAP